MGLVQEVTLKILGSSDSAVRASQETAAALRGVQAAADEASASATTLGAKTVAAGSAMEAMGAKTVAAGRSLTTHLTLPMAAVGAVSAKMAMDFDQAMTLVQTQAGASADEVATMRQAILDLGGKVQETPKQLAEGLYWIESAGFRGAQALDVLKVSADLASVAQTDMSESANAVSSLLKAMPDQFRDVADAAGMMNAVVGNGKMTMADLNAAIGTGFLSAAETYGVSAQSVGSALAFMTAQGIPATDAATKLKMAMTLLAAPTPKAVSILKSLGISEEEVKGSTDAMSKMFADAGVTQSQLAYDLRQPDGLQVAMADLKQHLVDSGVDAVAAGDMIARAFGGGRTGTAIMAMINDVGGLQQKYDAVGASVNSFGDAVQTQSETSNAKWHEFVSKVEADMIDLGEKILPGATKAFEDLAAAMDRIADWYSGLSPKQQELIIYAGLAAAALGPVMAITGNIITLVGGVTTAVGVLIGWLERAAAAWLGVGAAASTAAAEETAAAGAGGAAAAGAGGALLGIGSFLAVAGAIAYGIGIGGNAASKAIGLTSSDEDLAKMRGVMSIMQQMQDDWNSKSYASYRDHISALEALTGQHNQIDLQAMGDHFGALLVDQYEGQKKISDLQKAAQTGDAKTFKKQLDDMLSGAGLANANLETTYANFDKKRLAEIQMRNGKELQLQMAHNKHEKEYQKQQNNLLAQIAQDYDNGDYVAYANHLQQLRDLTTAHDQWWQQDQRNTLTQLIAIYGEYNWQFSDAGRQLIDNLYHGMDDPQTQAWILSHIHDGILTGLGQRFGFVVPTGGNPYFSNEANPNQWGSYGQYSTAGQIAGHAAGGWVGVSGPEVGLLGEEGPEYVIPNHMLSAYGLGQKVGKRVGDFLAGHAMDIFEGVAGAIGAGASGLGKMLAAMRGWVGPQWDALYQLFERESGWNPWAVNPSSGAAGIPQALGHGHVFDLGDAYSQILWGLDYIAGRYGTPAAAWQHELDYGWYGSGGTFVAERPGIFHAGEHGPEQVTVAPVGRGAGSGIVMNNPVFHLPGVKDAQQFALELGRITTRARTATLTAGAL